MIFIHGLVIRKISRLANLSFVNSLMNKNFRNVSQLFWSIFNAGLWILCAPQAKNFDLILSSFYEKNRAKNCYLFSCVPLYYGRIRFDASWIFWLSMLGLNQWTGRTQPSLSPKTECKFGLFKFIGFNANKFHRRKHFISKRLPHSSPYCQKLISLELMINHYLSTESDHV